MLVSKRTILGIAFLEGAHFSSSRSAAYLTGARPKRSLEGRRRERYNLTTTLTTHPNKLMSGIIDFAAALLAQPWESNPAECQKNN
jgi:hypothetical protein